jgi:rubrerythrin
LEALQALRELDELGARDADDDELEREIAELRARLQCPRCGALREPGEECPECGAPA